MLYGAIAGGVILLLLLLGIVSRSIRKRANKKTAEQPAIELDDEPEQDEFDDLFSDLDDIDIDTDEFDDLLDEFWFRVTIRSNLDLSILSYFRQFQR